MLGGVAVVLQHLGDGALVDALQTQLPLSQFQEAPGGREGDRGCVGGRGGREIEGVWVEGEGDRGCVGGRGGRGRFGERLEVGKELGWGRLGETEADRKSTRLNSSHL